MRIDGSSHSSGEIHRSSEVYRAYVTHLERTGGKFSLPTEQDVEYLEFSSEDFARLELSLSSPLLSVVREPELVYVNQGLQVVGQSAMDRFDIMRDAIGAWAHGFYDQGEYRMLLYYNRDTEIHFNPHAADALLEWVNSIEGVAPFLFREEMVHYILLGRFDRNPIIPQHRSNGTVVGTFDDGERYAVTGFNVHDTESLFDRLHQDLSFVTEMMQALIETGDEALQESLPNSIGLAYVYAANKLRG